MTLKVAVAGATGYAGGEILRLLLGHPAYQSGELVIGALTANANSGQTGAALLPHVPQLADRVMEKTDPAVLAGHDVVFLGLPHGYSADIAKKLPESTLILDCAADFRLENPADWVEYYGNDHAGTWPYGIPEMPGHRERIAASRRVAIPGCFPTGATLAAMPAIQAGIARPDVNVVSVTGVSGAGKKARVSLLGSETMGSLKAYGTGGRHRHTPEIAQNIAEVAGARAGDVKVSFTPVLAPLPRGILTTVTAPLEEGVDTARARQVYLDFYASEQFVWVMPEGIQPQTKNVVGTNMCHLQVEADERSGKLLVTTAIDNLTKGTAGAAVQCMNIALGFDETAGLPTVGVAP
ncbi:N-acetyl-gamma-glutamyl-phosphate reductase [Corynebacterium capitovis DSM 44611]|uniref:N-acetyl-gamma-glutamyl-phosphate reductase n=1 Tax=Corynebacterium capitovis TaxID=131081 RepID=UPI00047644E0|nr:N-acetyl-gamma-glutamyl-phosphate reductase [Corynebacterium capitovis]WKD57734.1 N-acetyl-gamma-glutamyl-phosphate reductase [Corynebacterium capitovis DSM 44611]